MLEVFVNFICAFMLAFLGFYMIKKIINSNKKVTLKIIILFTINSFLVAMIHYFKYNSPTLIFIINTITYKEVFNITIIEASFLTGLISLFILLSESIGLLLQFLFIPLYKYRSNLIIYFINNTIVIIITMILLKIKIINNYLQKIYTILSKNNYQVNVIFIILIIILESKMIYNIFINYNLNNKTISDIIVIISLLAIAMIFINNKNNYNRLSDEYDLLLSNVQTFEEWIEKEQFTRHEYKNQLAVLYALSSESEVKNKIQEIINQNLNIKNEVVNNLKDLPKGGLKGLLYYKTIIAEKKKIKITVDVSINQSGILKKMSKEKISTIAKLAGIYYDNAIDASKESRKKHILLEIYELKDRVNIVISNTFNKKNLIDNRYGKGITSKGKGHGNGLYFAKKILNKNNWIEEKQEIIDNYYIETITIKKSTLKK